MSIKVEIEKELKNRGIFGMRDDRLTGEKVFEKQCVITEVRNAHYRAKLRNVNTTRHMKRLEIPINRIRAELERKSRPTEYFGQSMSYGPRHIVSVKLLNGATIDTRIPISGDTGFSDYKPIGEILGGFKISKWVESVKVDYVWYDWNGFSWYSDHTPTSHRETMIISREDLF